jgi:putative Holliday junction resolvase
VAVGNSETGTGQALTTLKARDGVPNWEQVQELIHTWNPRVLLVGRPINMDGSDSELSRLAEKFGRRLRERFRIPVEFEDERLSSFEAKQLLSQRGHRGNYKADPADSLAAALILETWLARQDVERERGE